MSDRSAMSIEIGGNLAEEHIGEFLDLIDKYALSYGNYYSGIADEEEIRGHDGGPLALFNSEIAGGMCEDLEAFCREHDLSYVRGDDGHYAYSAEVEFWEPGMVDPKNWRGNNEHQPFLSLATIRLLQSSGTLERELELMFKAENFTVAFKGPPWPEQSEGTA